MSEGRLGFKSGQSCTLMDGNFRVDVFYFPYSHIIRLRQLLQLVKKIKIITIIT